MIPSLIQIQNVIRGAKMKSIAISTIYKLFTLRE